jgi:hypothetical protein
MAGAIGHHLLKPSPAQKKLVPIPLELETAAPIGRATRWLRRGQEPQALLAIESLRCSERLNAIQPGV